MAGREQLNERIVKHYRTIAKALDRLMIPRLIELGITMPQFKALLVVVAVGLAGISVTDLGNELAIGQPSASIVVDQLQEPGYVRRVADATDRRRVLVVATALGSEVAGELRHGRRAVLDDWLAEVSDGDAEALERGLAAFAAAAQASSLGREPVG